jgi:predicted small lipoprotein YifL
MLLVTMSDRNAARAAAIRAVPAVLLVLLLALLGCGQQGPAKAQAAKSAATDTVAQVQPSPTDSSAQQPELNKAVSATTSSEPAKSSTPSPKPASKATGLAALERAATAGKYLLLLFYRNDDDSTRAMKKVIASAAAKLASKANSITINVTDAAEREIVAKYQVDRAPMPLALVVAPSGAITGGFVGKVTEEQLSGAFVSPGLANSLKALQDGKLVLLCVQNASTKSNDAAMRGVNAFITDTRFAKSTEVVSLDPTDEAESKFLKQLQIDPKTSEAVTALMAPPNAVVAQYKGATDKDVMIAALAAKQAGGGGG